MNILFFSYLSYDNLTYSGGGWVNSLADLLASIGNHQVAIAFATDEKKSVKRKTGNITYYPMYRRITLISKIVNHLRHQPYFFHDDRVVNGIIDDFRPSVIQLFGMETPFGGVLRNVKNAPVVAHIQGILSLSIYIWYSGGLQALNVWWHAPLRDKLMGATAVDFNHYWQKLAKQEKELFKVYRYYLGRTDWDRQVSRVMSPDSKYYICNEVLRPEFYEKEWKYTKSDKVIISTTINGEIYKGFDTMLRAALLLEQLGVDYEWDLYGVNEKFPLRRAIEKHIGRKFCDTHIRFCGRKNAAELADLLSKSTFYVHPSHIDNSPNSLCEAMLVGVPSIATYVGGVPSMLEHGVTGFLVPDCEAYQIAYIISHTYANEELLNKISINSRARAKSRHDKENIVRGLILSYSEIIADFSHKNY